MRAIYRNALFDQREFSLAQTSNSATARYYIGLISKLDNRRKENFTLTLSYENNFNKKFHLSGSEVII